MKSRFVILRSRQATKNLFLFLQYRFFGYRLRMTSRNVIARSKTANVILRSKATKNLY